GCRGDVVTGDRQAILETGDTAAGGVEVGCGLGLARGPPGDGHGASDEQQEHDDGFGVGPFTGFGKGRRCGKQREQGGEPLVDLVHSTSLTISSSSGSNHLLEKYTYSAIRMTALQTTMRPTNSPTLIVQFGPRGRAKSSGR